ncbi:MAG TPA: hypothetical protein VNX28_11895 [Gemmataceae bacterium]|nr:hypothetical protein [Gemmataceae bacterium]
MASSRRAPVWARFVAASTAALVLGLWLGGAARAEQLIVTNISDGKLEMVDTNTNAISVIANVGGGPDSLIFDASGRIIYTNLTNGSVHAFDPVTNSNTVLATGLGSTGIQDLALEPSKTSVVVSDPGGGNIFRVSLAGGSSLLTSGVGVPRGIVYDASGNLFVADGNDGTIRQLNPVTGATIRSIRTGFGIDGLTFDPVTGHLWAANAFGGGLGLAEIPTDLSSFTQHTSSPADGIESDGQGHIFMADSQATNKRIFEYDIATGTTTALTPVPGIDDLAPIVGLGSAPEPASLTLTTLAIRSMAGYGWYRRKRAQR